MNNLIYTNVRVIYQKGVLIILDPLPLSDGTRVRLDIQIPEDAPIQQEFDRYPTVLVPALALAPLIGIVEVGGDALADSEDIYG